VLFRRNYVLVFSRAFYSAENQGEVGRSTCCIFVVSIEEGTIEANGIANRLQEMGL
jgi:hypothetical protein